MEVSGFSEAEIRELIRIRQTDWREEDDHVDLEDVAAKVQREREALQNLANEVYLVTAWLTEKETEAKVGELYGK